MRQFQSGNGMNKITLVTDGNDREGNPIAGDNPMTQHTTRRETLFSVASAAGALALGSVREADAQSERRVSPAPNGQMTMADHDMKACIDECEKSHRVCAETARYCLDKGGRHVVPAHIGLLLDCDEICQTTAHSMLRGSAVHKTMCGACAEICERCAESCDSTANDAQMTTCAKTCRACAESCRKMAKG